jgi:hypothetical protein
MGTFQALPRNGSSMFCDKIYMSSSNLTENKDEFGCHGTVTPVSACNTAVAEPHKTSSCERAPCSSAAFQCQCVSFYARACVCVCVCVCGGGTITGMWDILTILTDPTKDVAGSEFHSIYVSSYIILAHNDFTSDYISADMNSENFCLKNYVISEIFDGGSSVGSLKYLGR